MITARHHSIPALLMAQSHPSSVPTGRFIIAYLPSQRNASCRVGEGLVDALLVENAEHFAEGGGGVFASIEVGEFLGEFVDAGGKISSVTEGEIFPNRRPVVGGR